MRPGPAQLDEAAAAVRAPRVVTAGESMALVIPGASGRLRHATCLSLSIAGAESNVAIGLCRLGIAASWVSALGDDELGELVLHRIRAEGVDTGAICRVASHPTGLCLREEVGGLVRIYYYRRGSAASTLAPGAFDPTVLAGASFLHPTGITPALSAGSAEFVRWAASLAREHGVRVSYDVNYRSKLWDPPAARAFTCSLLPLVDVVLVGADEAEVLWGWTDEDTALGKLADAGPTEVVIKRGAEGSVAEVDGDRVVGPPFRVRQVDPIGAGDAFAAGYLASSVWGYAPQERLRTANALGALCVQHPGDYEGLPTRQELTAFIEGIPEPGR
jgi:2-dehydro-3-deoxygluconokinase